MNQIDREDRVPGAKKGPYCECGGQLKCQVSFIQTYECIIDGDRVKLDDDYAPETECLVEQVFCKDCGKVIDMDTDNLYVDDVIIVQQGE